MKDRILYDRLELSPDLSHHQLKKEGKKLLLKWHPDKNPDNQKEASKKFIEIKEALDVLTDPEKREKYHQLGMDMFNTHNNNQNQNHNHPPPFAFSFPFPSPFQFQQGFPFHFPQFQQGFPFASKKEQIVYELKINLNKMREEEEFTIVYNHSTQCQSCKCKECKGTGKTVKQVIQGRFIQNFHVTCFICGGIGSFKDENCNECKGSRLLILAEKKIEMKIRKDMLTSMIANHHSITVKNIDHDLIIIPSAI